MLDRLLFRIFAIWLNLITLFTFQSAFHSPQNNPQNSRRLNKKKTEPTKKKRRENWSDLSVEWDLPESNFVVRNSVFSFACCVRLVSDRTWCSTTPIIVSNRKRIDVRTFFLFFWRQTKDAHANLSQIVYTWISIIYLFRSFACTSRQGKRFRVVFFFSCANIYCPLHFLRFDFFCHPSIRFDTFANSLFNDFVSISTFSRWKINCCAFDCISHVNHVRCDTFQASFVIAYTERRVSEKSTTRGMKINRKMNENVKTFELWDETSTRQSQNRMWNVHVCRE